jgi:predicted transcriptional regulator of viral defense system
MERKLKPIYVQQTLLGKGVRLFSPSDFQRVFGVSMRAAQEFIKDHCGDLFLKVRNGLYALRAEPPQDEAIANRLYAPSYISFEYALARYGIIPESVYAITSATTRITREFIANNKSFTYSHIKKQAYRGYKIEKIAGTTVLIAEPEKAFVDYLYFVDLKRKTINGRLNVRKIKKKAVMEYVKLFGRNSLVKLAKEIL